MPTRIYNRVWCKSCEDFKLHEPKKLFEKPMYCKVCDTQYETVDYSKLPKEKIQEQRVRYQNQKRQSINAVIGSFLSGGYGPDGFGGISSDSIIEDDAGQKELDEIEHKKREKIYLKKRIQREKDLKLKEQYHKLGRNDKCLCGSNLKYKKCCYNKINKI